ncbi:MAG: hypothetical protein NC244_14145 [Alistipes senegalensis]|nr:hypothetical protein [Alistipes senegalensis]
MYHYKRNEKYEAFWMCTNKACKCRSRIKEPILSEVIFETLKKHMEVILNHSEPMIKSDFMQNINVTSLEIIELEKQIEQLKKSQENLLLQKENGVISEKDYSEMSEFYNNKIAGTEFEAEEIRSQKLRLLECADEIKNQYEKYFSALELTRSIVVTFIEKIEVFSKTKVKIHFRYENFFRTGGETNGT